MADDNSQFDEELLSAYLDDELTAEERARVEERLAAEPAARQLFDELRSVSQAMRGLPHEKLGSDLRDSVLRRAERAMLVAGDAGSVNRVEPVARRLPFGRSKRAWFWAGAAIAAALMLMFIERDGPKNADLPREVALNKPRADARDAPLPPLAMRAIGDAEVAEGVAADRRKVEEKDFAAPGGSLGVPVATAPMPALSDGDAATSENRASSEAGDRFDSVARSSEMANRGGGMMGGAGGVSSGGVPHRTERFVEDAAGNEHLVVHVSLTPEAVQNRAFDATLLKNQIEVEAEAASEAEMLADQPAAQEVDVVVVEAAPAQVYSTLAEINRDTKNYAGIEIQPQAVRLQASAAKSKLQAVEEDVRRYNRGRVPNRQQVQLTPDYRNFYYMPQQNLMFRAQQELSELKEKAEQQSPAVPSATAEDTQLATSSTSQGQSAQSLALERDKLDAVTATGQPQQDSLSGRTKYYFGRELLGHSQQNLARRAAQKLAVKADTLQVMFVLQPEQDLPAAVATPAAPLSSDASSATSPVPATEQVPATESAPAQEEGLKPAE